MQKRIFFLSLLLCIAIAPVAFAQKDSVRKSTDSVNNTILKNFNEQLQDMEQERINDSAKRAALEAQLLPLKTVDNLKKAELQKQLSELASRDSIRLQQKRAGIDSLRSTAKRFPVFGFFNDTLFFIYSRLGSFSAAERAEAISRRIHALESKPFFRPDSLYVVSAESTTDLAYKDEIIMSISEEDAIWSNSSRQDLAVAYKKIIGEAITTYKGETSWITMLKHIGLALLIVLVLVFLIRYITRIFRWIKIKIRRQEGKRLKALRFKNYTLFDEKHLSRFLSNVITVVKWIFILLFIYISLPLIFGLFPWTQPYTETLIGYIINPLKSIFSKLWHFLPNLITILVIVFLFRYILRGLHYLKKEIESGALTIQGFYADWANPTYQIVRVLVFAFMIVVIFPYLPGSESPVFRGVSVFLGFLFTFGSAGSLSNIIAGLVLTYMRLFKIGDRVKIGEITGDVIEKSMLVTRLRTIKNEIISIPNSTVMSSHTTNYSSDAPVNGLVIHTTVTIGYDVPWKDMHQALIDAALRTEHILKEPIPFVLQTSLDDFYVSYQCNAYTKEPNRQAVIYSNLHQHIQDVCNERGIEIMSPHYRASRDGNKTTIPEDYLPKDYQQPGFNIQLKKED
ncbi:MAG: mechanosensitive ion channel domain-containing protein [Ferruginibacter sp.]